MQKTKPRHAFTLTEVLVVMMMLAILISLVLYASSGFSQSDALLRSQNHLREVNQYMQNYTNSNNGRIVPSQFNRYDEEGDSIGGAASRMAYSLNGENVEWIGVNNPYQSLDDPAQDLTHVGTWADLIWVESNLGDSLTVADMPIDDWGSGSGELYRSFKYSAPDRTFYKENDRWEKNPLRSVAVNTWNWPRWDANGDQTDFNASIAGTDVDGGLAGLPVPRGSGAWERNMPGFFAANNFFDSRSLHDVTGNEDDSRTDRYWSEGQIKAPARSVYLVDSFAGETIGGTPGFLGSSDYATQQGDYYDDTVDSFYAFGEELESIGGDSTEIDTGICTQEVDFRYGKTCLMLFLDGHVGQEEQWGSLWDLEGREGNPGRSIRILDLDKRKANPDLASGG
ncbi:MAG: type II secretion system protein [Phycisphaerales bacterium]|nr:type II secretion system protein [Phycisphaerales bacterium]|tara:strand:- start:2053 stop:3240 length:1188 start_codon:yes stop_codon:yes gene_type:complete